jgi:hypothetical protein
MFLDQDAIPTLVEVKRSSDTRIRREVIGQMLDYAANGAQYWGEGALRLLFEGTCAAIGRDPGAVLEQVIGARRLTRRSSGSGPSAISAAGCCGWCSSPT